jgi:4-hydroxy-tetrahydrodipicolinate synthase
MGQSLKFSGVIPANILPFNADYSIDETDYRRHLHWLADVPGVTGITVNGHAAEVSSLSREERRRTLAIALDEVGSRLPLIAGIYTDSTMEAVELARDARAEGATGLLIFPPSQPLHVGGSSFALRWPAAISPRLQRLWTFP